MQIFPYRMTQYESHNPRLTVHTPKGSMYPYGRYLGLKVPNIGTPLRPKYLLKGHMES